MSTAPQTVAPALSALGFSLNFFKLVVRDIDAMADFYARAFGFEQRGERLRFPGIEEAMLALPGEQFTLVLYHWTDGREIAIGTGHGPVGLLTRDVDAAYAHALAHGATDMRAPIDLPGMRLAFVRDPEGHEIEMIQLKRPAAARE
jgi:lactoylglutathione lyase